MIPDINLVREKSIDYQNQQREAKARRNIRFREIESEVVPYFYNKLESDINNLLLSGQEVWIDFEYKDVHDYVQSTYQFYLEDYECFIIMDSVVNRIDSNYTKAGYGFKLDRLVMAGSHFDDSYRLNITFWKGN